MKVNRSIKVRRLVTRSIFLSLLTGTIGLGFGSSRAEAENWMFNRSYYSHQLPPEVAARYPRPESRSAYRLPQLATTPGFALKGARRWNYVRLYNGSSYDTTILRSDTFDVVSP
ncbi:hypothetical protein [Gimesia fumaroli]|jgi:hypothetical protein|uniref:Uncharacterized protein n=1 Tax=Gimesia fumaroli TaxID=2527976 RepID=A0A518IHG0_9PLAN|nr:hypothetical protein [Gimesia fumaroli]QDV52522.1 hypothetical protein Enr17x_45850 [Gimesia fumaroli]